MTLLRDASILYSSVFSVVIFLALFEPRFPQKKTRFLILLFSAALISANAFMLFCLGVQVMTTLMLITCSLPSLIFFWYLARQRDGRFFFTFCLADTIILWILCVTSVLDFYLGNSFIFMAAARLTLCPLLTWVIIRWIRPGYREVQNNVDKSWGIFAAIALIFYLLLTISSSTPTLITQRPDQLPAFTLLLLLMPILYLYIFRTLHMQMRAHEAAQNESILLLHTASLTSRIEEYSIAAQRAREDRHNFRHQLQTITALAQSKQYAELENLLKTYTRNLTEASVRSYCTCPVIDAVLVSYLRQAELLGVRIVTKISFPDPLPVSEPELATVFANAIENAVRACEDVEKDQRYIEIQVLTVPCFMLRIRNSCRGSVRFDEHGVPVSNRPDHGFGTRSIVSFCKKNNAFYEFKAEDDVFDLCIVFQ